MDTFSLVSVRRRVYSTQVMTRHPLLTRIQRTVNMLITSIEHLPGGHLWWYGSIPRSGRHNRTVTKREWSLLLYSNLYPQQLLTAMIQACVDANGKPDRRGLLLYQWMLHNVYNGNVRKFYQQWLVVKEQHDAHVTVTQKGRTHVA